MCGAPHPVFPTHSDVVVATVSLPPSAVVRVVAWSRKVSSVVDSRNIFRSLQITTLPSADEHDSVLLHTHRVRCTRPHPSHPPPRPSDSIPRSARQAAPAFAQASHPSSASPHRLPRCRPGVFIHPPRRPRPRSRISVAATLSGKHEALVRGRRSSGSSPRLRATVIGGLPRWLRVYRGKVLSRPTSRELDSKNNRASRRRRGLVLGWWRPLKRCLGETAGSRAVDVLAPPHVVSRARTTGFRVRTALSRGSSPCKGQPTLVLVSGELTAVAGRVPGPVHSCRTRGRPSRTVLGRVHHLLHRGGPPTGGARSTRIPARPPRQKRDRAARTARRTAFPRRDRRLHSVAEDFPAPNRPNSTTREKCP